MLMLPAKMMLPASVKLTADPLPASSRRRVERVLAYQAHNCRYSVPHDRRVWARATDAADRGRESALDHHLVKG